MPVEIIHIKVVRYVSIPPIRLSKPEFNSEVRDSLLKPLAG